MRHRAEKRRAATERAVLRDRHRHRQRTKARRFAWASEMCSTCAYRPGTEASREEGDPGLTAARVALLAACLPFYCHEEPPPGVGAGRKLCVGHANRLTRMYRERYEVPEGARDRAAEAVRRLNSERAITDALTERGMTEEPGAPRG